MPGIDDTVVISGATLQAVGHLFAAFNVEHLVGVGLLHKHFNLAPETIMVHNGHVCKPQPVKDSLSTTGTSFFWNGTDFQAFEYGQEEPLALPNDFLKALANHLETHQLSGKVALSKLDTKKTFAANDYAYETMSRTRTTHDHKVAVLIPIFLWDQN